MKIFRRITLLALIVIPAGVFLANINDWRASRYLTTARSALKSRDVELAMSAILSAERLAPNNGEVYLYMASAYRRKGELTNVRKSLERASILGVSQNRIRREEWLAMAQAGQMTEAAPHLRELLLNPGDDGAEICEAYANGYFLNYRLGEAFAILDAWEKDYPQDAQPHFFRAAFSSKTDNWNATVKHLRKALELAPKRIDVRIELANTLLILQESDEAAKLFAELQKIQPDHPEVLMGWAQILLERGQHEQARSTLDQVLRIDSKHVVALRLRGEIHSLAGQVTEAIKLLEEAVAIKSSDRQARYVLATVLKKAGRDAEARQHFQFVAKSSDVNARFEELVVKVRNNNGDVESRFEIAELLREVGETTDRLQWLRSIIELDPSHKAAHAELAKYYAALGDLEESRKHSLLAENNRP